MSLAPLDSVLSFVCLVHRWRIAGQSSYGRHSVLSSSLLHRAFVNSHRVVRHGYETRALTLCCIYYPDASVRIDVDNEQIYVEY